MNLQTDEFAFDAYANTTTPNSAIASGSIATALQPLAHFSSDEARLSRMIGRGCGVPLEGLENRVNGARRAMLSLYPAPLAVGDWNQSLVLQYSFGTLEIAQGPRLVRALSGIDIGTQAGASGDRWELLQAAAIGRMSNTPLAGAQNFSFGLVPVEEVENPVILQLQIGTAAHAFSHYVRAGANTWLQLIERSVWIREKLNDPTWLYLMLDAAVVIARHTLPSGVAGSVRAGDIIVPNAPRFNCEGEGLLRLGDMQTRIRYSGPGMLEIIAMEGKMEFEGSEQDDVAPIEDESNRDSYDSDDEEQSSEDIPDQIPVDLSTSDAVPMVLDFQLGRVRMALGDVRALGPGVVVPFTGSAGAIEILSGGRRLGHGEVVSVGGELAIRIVQWGVIQ